MIFSRETMKEIVEDYVKKNYNWDEVQVESFVQRKVHNSLMFEATLTPGKNEQRNPADEA